MGYIEGADAAVRETERKAAVALAAAQSLADARQAEAGAFITDHGHQVVGGHSPLVAGQDQRGRDAGSA